MASSNITLATNERAGGDRVRRGRMLSPLHMAPRRARISKGVLPLKDLAECGRVHETGFVWMKQKAPSEHFFEGTKTLVSYGIEVTAYVEKFKMKKMSGVKSKQMFVWVPVSEMSVDGPKGRKIYFKTPMGVGKSFPVTAFMTEEEMEKKLMIKENEEIKEENY